MRRADTPDGLYVVGDPVTGEKGTRTGEFYNDVQEEICNVIEAAGIALNPAQRNQLLLAIAVHSVGAVFTDIGGSGKKCRIAFEVVDIADDGSDVWALVPQTVI